MSAENPPRSPRGRLARTAFGTRLTLIVALGLVVRLLHLLLVAADNPLSGDAASYHLGANLFADGLGFTEPFRYLYGAVDEILLDGRAVEVVTPIGHLEPTAGHPPGWTLLLGIGAFLGLTGVFEAQLLATVLGLPAIALVGLAGRRLGSERLGLISAGLAATYAFVWINDGLLMAETVAIGAAAGTVLVGLQFATSPDRRNAALLGLVGGLAALCRAELVLYLPLVAAIVLVNKPLQWRERLLRYFVVGLAALAVVSPWIVRNLLVFEEPVLLSNGAGTVLVQANCDPTYYGPDLGYWQISCGQPAPYGSGGELLDESQRDRVVRDRAFDYIRAHQGRLVDTVVPARAGRLWAVYQPVGQLRLDTLVDRRSFAVSVLGLVQYYLLVPFAAAGMVLLWRRRRALLVVTAWIPVVTLTAVTAFGNTRYRTAAEVSLILLAAVAIDATIGRWSSARTAQSTDPPVEQPPGGSS